MNPVDTQDKPKIATKAVTVIGMSDDGCLSLTARALNSVQNAQVLMGGERHLAFFPQFEGTKIPIKGKLMDLIDKVDELSQENNVVVLASGDPLFFGIGGLIGKQSDANPGGSPYSASPQQLDGRPGSIGDDIYAVGAMLYALMSGKPPFYPDLDKKMIAGQVPAPPKTDYPPPDGLVELVMRILATDPLDRPASIGEVRELLAEIMGVASTSTRPPGESAGKGVATDKIQPCSQ